MSDKLPSERIHEFCQEYTWEEPDDLMTPSQCVQAAANHTNKICSSINEYLDEAIPEMQRQIKALSKPKCVCPRCHNIVSELVERHRPVIVEGKVIGHEVYAEIYCEHCKPEEKNE